MIVIRSARWLRVWICHQLFILTLTWYRLCTDQRHEPFEPGSTKINEAVLLNLSRNYSVSGLFSTTKLGNNTKMRFVIEGDTFTGRERLIEKRIVSKPVRRFIQRAILGQCCVPLLYRNRIIMLPLIVGEYVMTQRCTFIIICIKYTYMPMIEMIMK